MAGRTVWRALPIHKQVQKHTGARYHAHENTSTHGCLRVEMNGSTTKKSSSYLGHRSDRNAESLPAATPALCTGAISYLSSGHDGNPHPTIIKGELGARVSPLRRRVSPWPAQQMKRRPFRSRGCPQLSGFAGEQAQEVLCREG